jgi:hypothetical protein
MKTLFDKIVLVLAYLCATAGMICIVYVVLNYFDVI